MADIQDINLLLLKPNAVVHEAAEVSRLVSAFLSANGDLGTSPNLHTRQTDELAPIMSVLSNPFGPKGDDDVSRAAITSHLELQLQLHVQLLKLCKVLFRKDKNRLGAGLKGVHTIIRVLHKPASAEAACEAANVILNLCFETVNVRHFLELGGLDALLPLIQSDNVALQASSLGALQSVCFEHTGRQAAFEAGLVAVVVTRLASEEVRVRVRAVGALHNMSSDMKCVGAIKDEKAVPVLVGLLRSSSRDICASAAGTLQNVSREPGCRLLLLREGGAVEGLADLLVGTDIQSQVSAAGALLNIMGPDISPTDKAFFHNVLSDGIVLGAIQSCLT